MTNLKSTKRALLTSVIALLVCFAMLLGTTLAWFTDSAISKDNKIVSGDLKVELYQWTDEAVSKNISNEQDPVFSGDILWEPGRTEVVYLSIKNEGSLDLKYRVALEVTSVSDKSLTDVMSYEITPDAKYGEVTSWAGPGTQVEFGANDTAAKDVSLLSGEEHFFALSVHMDENAGNEYMNQSITFDIKVLAGQLASEKDSFGNTYDEFAGYPGTGYAAIPKDNTSAVEIQITDDNGSKVGSAVIPAAAADPTAEKLVLNVSESDYVANITVDDGMETIPYEVTVDGIAENNTEPVKVSLRIKAGLDPTTVKVYHYDTLIDSVYDPHTGYVTFETTSFSPFTIVCDLESEYVAPETEESDLPKANVVRSAEYENVDLPWGQYGAWSPTAGLDSQLEAAYTFTCTETLEEAKANPYANWYCDFYVVLDRDLGTNQIFLGGNYGSFGWVGFHNGDLTLDANTEIPLLGSVTTNPWSYVDVVQNVGTFICGVGDVDDALAGATFTVMLRLTNPDDETEFYNVATIEYTFTGTAVTDVE